MPKHFSFNVDAGRCDACKGEGEQLVEMQFLADVHLVCDVCGGKRFKEEVLEVQYQQKNIYDVLEMSVDEAIEFFSAEGKGGKDVARKIQPLSDVGLGYVKLGQSSNTLSGGEQQRVAVARALASQPTIIFADEPTGNLDSRTGAEILAFMRRAVRELGQTIVMVTHDPVAASYADRVIFLADGKVVDEMHEPTAERVLDRMKHFGD